MLNKLQYLSSVLFCVRPQAGVKPISVTRILQISGRTVVVLFFALLIYGCHPQSSTAIDPSELKAEDVPKDLPADIRVLVLQTYSKRATERAEAAVDLGKQGSRSIAAIPFLIRLLSDDTVYNHRVESGTDEFGPGLLVDVSVCDVAEKSLENIGTPAIQACLVTMKKSRDSRVQEELVEVLGTLKDDRAVDPLVGMIRCSDSTLRRKVVVAISGLQDDRTIQPLIMSLADHDADVRLAAANGMANRRDIQFVTPLLRAIGDKDQAVRRAVVRAIGTQRDRQTVQPLLKILGDRAQVAQIRWQAAQSLGLIGEPESLAKLLSISTSKSEPIDIRVYAVDGLAQSAQSKWFDPLSAILRDTSDSAEVRRQIVDAVAVFDSHRATQLLTSIAVDQNDDRCVRCGAAIRLITLTDGSISNPSIVRALWHAPLTFESSIAAIHSDAEIKRNAYRVLIKNGSTDKVREAAETALGATQ